MTISRIIKLMQKPINCFLLFILFVSSPIHSWQGSQTLEPNLNPNDVIFFEDFENSDNYVDHWNTFWNEPLGAGLISSPSPDVFSGSHSVFTKNIKDKHVAIGAGEYVLLEAIDDIVYARTYLKLEEDFSVGAANQLKLFGIRGGKDIESTYGGAGVRANGKNKFSSILAIDKFEELHFYYYHPKQIDYYGDFEFCPKFFCRVHLKPGQWHCLEMMLKLNTVGKKNGEMAAWLNNKLVINKKKLRFRNVPGLKIRRFEFVNYFGGGGLQNTSPKDQNIYLDNIVISKKQIGCLI